MKQVVYVDVLVILNIFINYFILLTCSAVMKAEAGKLRLLLGAFAGGLYSLVIFLPEMPEVLNLLTRVVAGGIIILIAFSFKTAARFIKLLLCFLAVTFLFAGMMIGIWLIFKPNGMVYKNSAVYFNINFGVIIISTTVCYLLSHLALRIFAKNKQPPLNYTFNVTVGEKEKSGVAMLDTGNTLCESFSGYPVVIGTFEFFKDILPEETHEFFTGEILHGGNISDEQWKKKLRLVPFSTVHEKSLLPCFRADRISIVCGKRKTETDKIYIAVTNKQKYLNEKFDMLLNPNIF